MAFSWNYLPLTTYPPGVTYSPSLRAASDTTGLWFLLDLSAMNSQSKTSCEVQLQSSTDGGASWSAIANGTFHVQLDGVAGGAGGFRPNLAQVYMVSSDTPLFGSAAEIRARVTSPDPNYTTYITPPCFAASMGAVSDNSLLPADPDVENPFRLG